MQFDSVIHNLIGQITHLEAILNEIVKLASTLPEYHYIKSIPGIGENPASRIMAKLGDINRFSNSSKLVAYAD